MDALFQGSVVGARGLTVGMQQTSEIADLDTGDTLTGVEVAVTVRRAAEVSLLHHAAHWADLHGDHDSVTRGHGATDDESDQRDHPDFHRLGGEGTPVVHEFSPAELAVSLRVHPLSARSLIADALDLRHRMEPLWLLTETDEEFEVWMLRKIASKTRHLPAEAAILIATDLAPLVGSLPAGRLLDRLESLVVLADAALDEAERQARLELRFVTFNRSNARGLKGLYAKLAAGDAIVGDAQIQRLADLLLSRDLAAGVPRADLDSMAVARSRALGLLIADPSSALALIADGAVHTKVAGAQHRGQGRAALTLYLHLSEDALQMLATTNGTETAQGVGRLEGHGPVNLHEALELLGLTGVTIRPVIDPAMTSPVDSYAFTGNLREAVLIRTPADVYPYARCTTHSMDVDHSAAFDPVRPARAQTSRDNAGPMTRHHHRIKTHGPMNMRQPVPDHYVWQTPHGRYRLTDATGTHDLDPVLGSGFFSDDPLDVSLSTLMLKHRLGLLQPA